MGCSRVYKSGKRLFLLFDTLLGGQERREEERSNGYLVKTADLCTLKEEVHEPVWNSTR
ncbi:MAG: hypothetical protein KAR35_06805 [Candidatus Heimdallarchaeota archaeon]|nr:hypothetical protein [Candidatus Heimdallarchaeota archaeon]MCK5049068.1 hypothetical protein [Candidatus Heimdallarchaeota archaeon]